MRRRTFLTTTAGLALTGGGATLLGGCAETEADHGGYLMPAEGSPHSMTWMAYGATAGT